MTTRLRVMREALGPFAAGELVRAVQKTEGGRYMLLRGKRSCAVAHLKSVSLAVPNTETIHKALAKVSGEYGVIWHPSNKRYRLVGFRFGEMSRVSVPVFADGHVESTKFVSVTRHVTLHASSFDNLAAKMFALAASGTLFGYYDKGKLERLLWNENEGLFYTEVVPLSYVKVK